MERWSRPPATPTASALGPAMLPRFARRAERANGRRRMARSPVATPGRVAAPRVSARSDSGTSFPGSRSTGIPCCSRPTSRARPASAAAGCGWTAPAPMRKRTGVPGSRAVGGGARPTRFRTLTSASPSPGGRVPMLGVSPAPTAVVVRLGQRVLRFAPPLARVRVSRRRMRLARPDARLHSIGSSSRARRAGRSRTGCLCPTSMTRRVDFRSRQVLAGQLWLRLRRGRGRSSTPSRRWPASRSATHCA